jgi:Flp pilus assembly protein TadG
MSPRFLLLRLARDRTGGAIIEFALLGPLVITMLLGVLQIGMAMQAYNALRSASSDVARYAVVERQKGATLSATALSTKARAAVIASPYTLTNANLPTATVSVAGTQRVSGATEYTLQYNYNVPNLLGIAGIGTIPLSYSRPIFVVS